MTEQARYDSIMHVAMRSDSRCGPAIRVVNTNAERADEFTVWWRRERGQRREAFDPLRSAEFSDRIGRRCRSRGKCHRYSWGFRRPAQAAGRAAWSAGVCGGCETLAHYPDGKA